MTLTDDEIDETVGDVDCFESRQQPVIHTSVQRPLCEKCANIRIYFDLKCAGCRSILYKESTTIAQVFAILRQWNPETQQNIEFYVREILRRGAHADDRDSSTGMTLLHFAVKAGADGISDPRPASRAIKLLISKGANIQARCTTTDMTPIHYASFFNSPTLIDLLMSYNIEIDLHDPSSVMDSATALHMSAITMAYEAAQCLLKYGADPRCKDGKGRSPLQCIPSVEAGNQDAAIKRERLVQLLSCQDETASDSMPISEVVTESLISKQAAEMNESSVVKAQRNGVDIGEEVLVGGIKRGWLRFVGPAQFAPGIWAGVELIDPIGKNNGTLNGVHYFTCKPNHGIFAPLSKVTKTRHNGHSKRQRSKSAQFQRRPSRSSGRSAARASSARSLALSLGKVNVSAVSSKIDTGRRDPSEGLCNLGDQVEIAGRRRGIVRFIGETHFATGIWYGIELTNAVGKNDGMINDIRYFTCQPDKGIFAPPSRVRRVRSLRPERSDKMPEKSKSGNMKRLAKSAAAPSLHNSDAPPMKTSKSAMSKSTMDLSTKRSFSQSRSKSLSSTNLTSKSLSVAASSNFDTGDLKLEKGLNVLCNNELATIRYIGPVNFADGLWLGIEFRKAVGKNDGYIDGKRYFTCTANHGLMVRPNRVSIRGINGAKLIDYGTEEILV